MIKNMKFTTTLLLTSAIALTVFTGCASKKANGNLLIIGGALDDKNKEVYGVLFDHIGTEESLGIIPTASGVPEETGPENLEFFGTMADDSKVELIDMPFNKPERGLDPEYAKQIEAQQGLYFLGGVQSRIVDVFRPQGEETVTYKAAKAVLDKGGIIAGSSAGAAMMSDPMIIWGFSPEALVLGDPNVPDRGVKTDHGMGFFPYGLTDQHFDRRGRLGRLITALEMTNQTRGYGISENRAILVNLKNHSIESVGTQAVMLVDLSLATKTGYERSNILLSFLGEGDSINGKTGKITLAETKIPFTATDSETPVTVPSEIWEVEQLAKLFLDFSLSTQTVVEAQDDFFTIRFTKIPGTKFYVSNSDQTRETIGFTNLRLDLIPRPELEANLEKLKIDVATPRPEVPN